MYNDILNENTIIVLHITVCLLELCSIVYQCYAIKKRLKFIRSLYKD